MTDELRGCELYFDCFAGIAGDMTLAALLDLGVPEAAVRAELERLPLTGYRLERTRVQRGALVGEKIHVVVDGAGGDHGHDHGRGDHGHDHAHGDHGHDHAHGDHGRGDHGHDHAHGDHDHDHDHGDHDHDHDHDHGDHDHDHLHGDRGHDRTHDDHGHDHSHTHADGHRHAHAHAHAHRHYRDIRAMLERHLDGDVRARALAMFARIAEVEARMHGTTIDEVAFHEVGAIDSIVDIVGAAAALAWLRPARITSRRVPLGGGSVDTAHGRLPVPAPATLELLRGAEVEAGGDVELTTPTGAAILAANATAYGPLPSLRVVAVGWGAGDRQLADRPNLLRVVAGVRPPAAAVTVDEHVVLEANVDDMSPELAPPLVEALLAAGALDAWLTPIVMKKGRPALLIGALCRAAERAAIADVLFRESTTLGVRFWPVSRATLERRSVDVDTPWGPVPVKLGGGVGPDDALNAAPELEACRRVAAAAGVPLKRVYAAALAAFYRR